MPPTLYLIDGHALAYRTYFALSATSSRFQTATGEPTAGIFGFASVLLRILKQDKPEYLAVAFDTGKTFRNELYPDYKATRAKMPDELRQQIERIRQMVDAFDIPRLEKEGVEADDILGSLARQAVELGLGVKIITGDKDLLQLVNDRVIVRLPGSKISESKDYFEKDVIEMLGVTPKQVVDYKALVGDTSDNYPGVKGIGEKTAVGLLHDYPTLDEIYANLDKVKERTRVLLESGKESAYLSLDLATIRTDVAITLDLEKARTNQLGIPAVEVLFRELEFRSMIPELAQLQINNGLPAQTGNQMELFGETVTRVGTSGSYSHDVGIIRSEIELKEMLTELAESPMIAFDTETSALDPMQANLVGISLSGREGKGYYIPVGHSEGEQLPLGKIIEALRPMMTDPAKPKTGHNLKFDCLILMRHGLTPFPLSYDTMLAEWVSDPDSHNLGLKEMAETYLDISMTHIEELIGRGKSQKTMAQVPIEQAGPYAAADAEVSLRLVPVMKKRLESRGKSNTILCDLELPLIQVLAQMEKNGIRLDKAFLKKMSDDILSRLGELDIQIQDLAGHPLNINSTQQLSKVLFEELKLPADPRWRTASGFYSTSADILEELRGSHQIIGAILEYRELAKLQSTYLLALPLQVNPQTNRIHTSYSQAGAVTGRLSSNNPNLQNIPTRTEIGRKVRCGFVADAGCYLLSVDYSQIELRIVADMSGDEAMLAAFRAGEDIHAATAAAILGIPLEDVTKDQRRHAKAVNFGLIYGMSAFGLTRSTDLTLAEAENFVREYFEHFPAVKKYLDGIRRSAAQQGFTETKLGRRRYFPQLTSGGNQNLRARAEREAINSPIQGTAADILKIAMIRMPNAIKEARLSAKMLLQVHDELVLECPQKELLATAKMVQDTMENAFTLSIPLTTDARWGHNWGEMKPILEFRE
jgi:DNA polymerase-1